MKTILVPIFNGHVARNIFHTDTYKLLKGRGDTNLVFVVPPEKVDFYKREYNDDNVEFVKYIGENINTDSRPERVWGKLLFHCVGTDTVFIKIKRNYLLNKSGLNWIKYVISTFVTIVFSRLDWLKQLFRYLYFKMLKVDKEISRLINLYNPDLIYAPHVYDYNCIQFLKAGKVSGVKTISTVNSWDNLSNRGLVPVVPDILIVHNQYLFDEAINDHLIKPKNLYISGMPHFDYYYHYKPSPKKDFYKKVGIDQNKKIILFGAATSNLRTPFGAVVKWLDEEIKNDIRLKDYIVLLRFYPNDVIDKDDFIKQNKLERANKVIYTWPCANNFGGGKNWEFTEEDSIFLADTLYYSNVLINYGSTLNIDMAAFDKPAINVVFDGLNESEPNSVQWFYERTHMKELYKTGGIKLAKNYKELKEDLITSIEHPEIDREGRGNIMKQQSWKFDGKAGERVANLIIGQLQFHV